MMTETGVVGILVAAIGGLWVYHRAQIEARLSELRQTMSDRIADRDKTIEDERRRHQSELDEERKRSADLEAKLERAQDILGKNTEALAQNAQSQQDVVRMLSDLFGTTGSPKSSETRTR